MKKAILPIVIIVAIATMYFLSVDMTEFNRADAAMALMTATAFFNLWTALRWYKVGFLTFEKMKQQEEAATAVINRLMTKIPKDEHSKVMGDILKEEIASVIDRVKEITNKS